ncbi:hypothetical protein BU23DRAFT_192071 [Bimuria novae-zelandiae CBS 107.79]|uniref:Uncharacterized protein n=1 Tax=Bimuria novae-zelandiae CBS 107.79 TaxID=1447943 RepID=A0A6A5VQY9_9PLEO|nr:hypothetical protein BU23DRAFT_192071 [Bimuria novae-zelandiae CBS 107.79]
MRAQRRCATLLRSHCVARSSGHLAAISRGTSTQWANVPPSCPFTVSLNTSATLCVRTAFIAGQATARRCWVKPPLKQENILHRRARLLPLYVLHTGYTRNLPKFPTPVDCCRSSMSYVFVSNRSGILFLSRIRCGGLAGRGQATEKARRFE